MESKFKKGQLVKLSVHVGGLVTYEKKKISRINKKGIWLDNGAGNRESGPFDPITGKMEIFAVGYQTIKAT